MKSTQFAQSATTLTWGFGVVILSGLLALLFPGAITFWAIVSFAGTIVVLVGLRQMALNVDLAGKVAAATLAEAEAASRSEGGGNARGRDVGVADARWAGSGPPIVLE